MVGRIPFWRLFAYATPRCSRYAVFYLSELVADGAECRKWYLRSSGAQKTDAQLDSVEE